FTFQWRKDGSPLSDDSRITGSTTFNLRITPTLASDAGNYDCVITGSCGTATTNAATLTATTALPNDTCNTALDVVEGTVNFNPCGAYTVDGFTPSCTTSSTPLNVWYRYTPSATRDIRIETCGANYDTVVSVYDGCAGSEIACNDN